MDKQSEPYSLWELLENITENLQSKRLADVFRFISFYPGETYGPHTHLRIEINFVKKGSCVLRLTHKNVTFREGEIMIITPNTKHLFEAGPEGTTLMQLEFLPEILSHLSLHPQKGTDSSMQAPSLSLMGGNELIKIVNHVGIMRTVQRIVNELEAKNPYYQHLVVMYYAEFMILIYRYMNEAQLPICTNKSLRKAVAYIRLNYHSNINITDVARHAGISERYLRNLFSQHLNQAPLDYLNQIRINKSIELLRNTEMSIKEICFQCGFQSPQYFSRIFKQQTGSSPREIKK
ncbi:AraC family transcriptional regulator [Parabacteroides sp.]